MPVTVEDSAGNTVTITEKPERIVSLPVWATEMLLDLVDTDRLSEYPGIMMLLR
jgi:ABC-type Fe3+-hydroxamate transport system substrate-binding protein